LQIPIVTSIELVMLVLVLAVVMITSLPERRGLLLATIILRLVRPGGLRLLLLLRLLHCLMVL